MKKKIIVTSIVFFLILIFFIFHLLSNKNKNEVKILEIEEDKSEETIYTSNIINNVKYSSTDAKGNTYMINATIGEIDYSNPNIVYLTNVEAIIKLTNSNQIKINSDYGKYNIDNFDTIFSKNVIVKYLENKIISEYMDFSLRRNSMIISKNVIYTNHSDTLKADVVEIDIDSKDTKIYRYNNKDKVNIKTN